MWVTAEQAQEVPTGGTQWTRPCLVGALDQGLAAPCRPRVGKRRMGGKAEARLRATDAGGVPPQHPPPPRVALFPEGGPFSPDLEASPWPS